MLRFPWQQWLFSVTGQTPRRQRPARAVLPLLEHLEVRAVLSASSTLSAWYSLPVAGNEAVSLEARKKPAPVDADDQISEAIDLGTFEGVTISQDGALVGTKEKAKKGLDVDVYAITVIDGQTLYIDIDSRGSREFDSLLRIFDENGQQIAANDNGNAYGESSSTNSYLQHTFDSAGTYYIGISGSKNVAYNVATGEGDKKAAMGEYRLIISEPLDLSTLNGTYTVGIAGSVTALGQTVPVPSALFPIDSFELTLEDGVVTTSIPGTTSASIDEFGKLTINATISAQSVNVNLNFTGQVEVVEGVVTGSGTWKIVNTLGVTGGGTWEFPFVPAADLDDEISEATAAGDLETPFVTTGSLASATDVDLYSFFANAGELIHIDIDLMNSSPDTVLRLFDADGNELAINDDGQAPDESQVLGKASYLGFTADESGTYYVGVSGYRNGGYNPLTGDDDVASENGIGNYTLAIYRDGTLEPSPYDGDYTGTFSGSVNVLLTTINIPADFPNNEVMASISNGVITVTVPGQGTGTIDENGEVGFTSALEIFAAEVGVSFEGTYVVDNEGHVTGSGTWTLLSNPFNATGSGTWTVSRVGD